MHVLAKRFTGTPCDTCACTHMHTLYCVFHPDCPPGQTGQGSDFYLEDGEPHRLDAGTALPARPSAQTGPALAFSRRKDQTAIPSLNDPLQPERQK